MSSPRRASGVEKSQARESFMENVLLYISILSGLK
jgi:hypothetical protein